MQDNIPEWWTELSPEGKWQKYELMKRANESHANTLSEITHYLLGNDYYTIAPDIFGANKEIIGAIKYHYKDANYNWLRTWNTICNAINNFLKR